MDKKLSIIGSIFGAIACALIVAAATMEGTFPKPLWFVAAGCFLINSVCIAINYRRLEKKPEKKHGDKKPE